MLDVYLIAMPYAAVERPSLALGILKASLINHGISAKVCYANILFAEQIGLRNYFFFSNSLPLLLMGEWTFGGVAFPDFQPDHIKYLQECKKWSVSDKLLWDIRNKNPVFIDQIAQTILKEHPKIVGCSSMFQQHCASLAVLKRIKALRPEVITLLGGANCEGTMGYVTHHHCEWVDYVVSGEAELLLPELCKHILQHGCDIPQENLPEGVYGPSLRTDGIPEPPISRAMVRNLDASPVPVYDDYFDMLNASIIAKDIKPGLVFETSRGCWWGQKEQCLFCGVNGSRITHRMKSSHRTLDELAVLHRKYGIKKFLATDSMLNMKYFETLLPGLMDVKDKYYIVFDILADLTKNQVKQLSEAGILWIQPGIESLHDNILGLLNKRNHVWESVQLLKWSQQYGVFVAWALLVNVPGESIEWYRETIAWLPLIYHLQPPLGQMVLHYDRFSPLHQHPDHFNLELEPLWFYSYIYPLSPDQLQDLAYYFEDVSSENKEALQKKRSVFTISQTLIETWQKLFYVPREDIVKQEVSENRPMLTMQEVDGQLIIKDTRPCAVESTIILEGLAHEIYKACDSAMTSDMLVKHLHDKSNRTVSWNDIRPIVEQLLAQKILLHLHDHFLSLAIREPYPKMLTHDDYPGGLVMIPRTKKQKKEVFPESVVQILKELCNSL